MPQRQKWCKDTTLCSLLPSAAPARHTHDWLRVKGATMTKTVDNLWRRAGPPTAYPTRCPQRFLRGN